MGSGGNTGKQLPVHKFVRDQMSVWPLARNNFRALKKVDSRKLTVGGLEVDVQFNPARSISTNARTDSGSIAARPCFLCQANRPAEQMHLCFEGAKRKMYHVAVNPYPIFPDHIVVASAEHTPQTIWHRFVDMMRLCKRNRDFTFLYNGPHCGASAPDHFHFQAIPSRSLPLENDVRNCIALNCSAESGSTDVLTYVTSVREASLYLYRRFCSGVFVIRGCTSKSVAKLFYRLLDCTATPEGDSEPRFNLFAWHDGSGYTAVVVLRRCHRSDHYSSTDPAAHLSMSPGCVDMGGVFITVERGDFEKLTGPVLEDVLSQITVSRSEVDGVVERLTHVQEMTEILLRKAPVLEFEMLSDGAMRREAAFRDGRVEYDGALFDELYFDAKTSSTRFAGASFVLYGESDGPFGKVVDRGYAGALRIVPREGLLWAVNIVGKDDLEHEKFEI